MTVSYNTVENFPGWAMAQDHFRSLIAQHGCQRILEIGAGANPVLSADLVRDRGLTYVISDVSVEELKKANANFERLVLDLSAKTIDPALSQSFDCILSSMVAEHVSDGHQYHANIYKMLPPGGISAHCCSTLWSLPFVANRYVPDNLGRGLLNIFQPRDEYRYAKFRACYSWSRGPSSAMIQRFERIGFEVINYTGYFGHNYYQRLPWLHRIETLKSQLLLKHPIPQLCTYAAFVLRKPS